MDRRFSFGVPLPRAKEDAKHCLYPVDSVDGDKREHAQMYMLSHGNIAAGE